MIREKPQEKAAAPKTVDRMIYRLTPAEAARDLRVRQLLERDSMPILPRGVNTRYLPHLNQD